MTRLTLQRPEAMTSEDIPQSDTRRPTPPTLRPARRHRLPTGTLTMLFCDIEGSTRLLRRLGGPGYAHVLGVQRRLLHRAFRACNGLVVDMVGDGCFAVFEQASLAVAAAVAAQHALAAYPWPEGMQVRVRMGVHTGEPGLFEEGYVGLDVHVAARICAAAWGGQILLSGSTRALVERVLHKGMGLLDVGPRRLKDLEGPVVLSEVQYTDPPCGSGTLETRLAA